MAMQAGFGVSKVVILIGAGLMGSVLVKNNRVSEFVTDISKVLSKHLKDDGDGRGEAGNEAALIAQVRYLSQQFHMLTTSPGSVTVVHTGSNTGSTFTSFVIPAAVVGAAGYGYMWWRGFSWGDVMYVTRKNMNNAVAGVGKQLEHVSAALQSTKRHLTQRLDSVTRTLDDSVAMTGLIKDQVYEVKGEVERSVYEIETVQRQIEGLEVKMDAVTEKQNFANQGIMILIRCVDRLNLLNGQQPELVQGFQSWMLNAGTLERTSSSPTVCGTPGLKELQFFSQVLEPKSPSVASTAEISTPLKSNIDCKPSVGLAGTISPGPSVQKDVLSVNDVQDVSQQISDQCSKPGWKQIIASLVTQDGASDNLTLESRVRESERSPHIL